MKMLFSCVIFLFLFSCVNKKRETGTIEAVIDSLDTVGLTKDTLSIVEPEEVSLPATGNELFEDFIYSFASNPKFQLSRIVFPLPYYEGDVSLKIEKKDWKQDALFVKQNYYTVLLDSENELELNTDNSVSSVQVEWIYMKTHMVKRYYFERINGRWMLEAINFRPMMKNRRTDFVDFFVRFAVDSLYQTQHIKAPLAFVTTDPDDDFSILETTLDPEQWFAFKPVLPDDKLSNILYGKETDESDSPYKILQLKGVGNGFLNTLFFYRKNGSWELYKFEDTSN